MYYAIVDFATDQIINVGMTSYNELAAPPQQENTYIVEIDEELYRHFINFIENAMPGETVKLNNLHGARLSVNDVEPDLIPDVACTVNKEAVSLAAKEKYVISGLPPGSWVGVPGVGTTYVNDGILEIEFNFPGVYGVQIIPPPGKYMTTKTLQVTVVP